MRVRAHFMWGSRRLEHKVFDDLVGALETVVRRDVSSKSDSCFEISCKSKIQKLVAGLWRAPDV